MTSNSTRRTSWLCMAAALAVSGCAASPANTAPEDVPSAQPTGKSVVKVPSGEGLCSFEVRDLPLERVIQYIRRASGQEIPIDSSVAGNRVSLKVESLQWRIALEELAHRAGGRVLDGPDGPGVVPASTEQLETRRLEALPPAGRPWIPTESGPGIVTVDLADLTVEEVVERISEVTETTIIVSPGLDGRAVRTRMQKVPWQQAMLTLAVEVNGTVRELTPRVLRLEKRPPGYLLRLERLLRRCWENGWDCRAAAEKKDWLLMAARKRQLREQVEELESALLQLPPAQRTGPSGDRLYTMVRRPLDHLRKEFRDLLQGEQ